MKDRTKAWIGCICVGLMLGALALAAAGCGTLAGIGRDITAWADGGAMDAGDNARAIREKGR